MYRHLKYWIREKWNVDSMKRWMCACLWTQERSHCKALIAHTILNYKMLAIANSWIHIHHFYMFVQFTRHLCLRTDYSELQFYLPLYLTKINNNHYHRMSNKFCFKFEFIILHWENSETRKKRRIPIEKKKKIDELSIADENKIYIINNSCPGQ